MATTCRPGVRVSLLVTVCCAGLTLAGCQDRFGSPTAPASVAVQGSTAERPPMVCRGGPGGSPCWTPGLPPPTGPQPPGASVLTFNGTAADGDFVELFRGDLYREGGLTMEVLESEVFLLDNDLHPDLGGFDDDAVHLDNAGAAVSFTRDGGGTFGATSIRVAQVNQPGSLRITGFFAGGGSIVLDVAGCGLGCIQNVQLSGFANLASLHIAATGASIAFDDLGVN